MKADNGSSWVSSSCLYEVFTGALKARAIPPFFLLPEIPTRENGLWRPPFFLLPPLLHWGLFCPAKNPYEALAVNQESQACLTSAAYVLSSSGQL